MIPLIAIWRALQSAKAFAMPYKQSDITASTSHSFCSLQQAASAAPTRLRNSCSSSSAAYARQADAQQYGCYECCYKCHQCCLMTGRGGADYQATSLQWRSDQGGVAGWKPPSPPTAAAAPANSQRQRRATQVKLLATASRAAQPTGCAMCTA